ncbi:Flagellin [Poriferisphaera corsica]|uniref:Flagellin n=1 Tax=Poriferisphaera corsica TaxID=2528020 RepID=A0A517YR40_9BACT|nr:flagellin [Poriferisphaera corsica]QDU32696.1 Flagellin [Poriferisphaera corsica]
MSRINTNVSSLIARNNLAKTNGELSTSLQRLSTGLRINRGADDPAGLIVSERLRAEMSGVTQSIDNIERASNVIATAESSLQEINTLVLSMKSLVLEAANTGAFSKEEIEANQLQIDSAIESVTRIANTTTFAGLKLLNGSLDYITKGVKAAEITDLTVQGVNFGTNNSLPVTVEVLQSAQQASMYMTVTDFDHATPPTDPTLKDDVSFEIMGNNGVEVFEFAGGTAISAMVFAINTSKDATGITAEAGVSGITLNSGQFGTDAFVSVRRLDGDANTTFQTRTAADVATAVPTTGTLVGGFDAAKIGTSERTSNPDGTVTVRRFFDGGTNPGTDMDYIDTIVNAGEPIERDEGADVLALVNGNLAVGDGLDVSLRTQALNLEMSLDKDAAQVIGSPYTFEILGGGATYQIGPDVNSQQQVGFGIQSVAASNLGNTNVGFLSQMKSGGPASLVTGSDPVDQARNADAILDAAINEISSLRGRIGAFEKNTLNATLASQQVALENLTASESQIRDADFAEETAKMTRAQVLQQAGQQTLSIANSSAQSVLSLLQS